MSGPRSTARITSAVHGAAVVVRVEGDLDTGTVHLFHDGLRRAWESPGVRAVVIDVSALVFCDSRGLSELITVLQRGQALDVRVMLSGVQGVLRRVLTITGLRNVFEQYETVSEALEKAAAAGPRRDRDGGEPDSGGLYETAEGR
ncbi:hypothetical protein GCM10010116_18430 [Microbispora rosea subsp. aerata]|nr:STAS domain-containing protein [Microbispora rosea]GGO09101.1 hypothetical protein GCM10010116_18430 [Microbispora rosea subsp. aerata]GIH55275.1 hypothetical protein Mro02_21890 [Microbispora rosea subsp. aerata]GLJ85582.1 hypothetical protein GCM10017588_43150 [Microbispora rosea subsp. aerata]